MLIFYETLLIVRPGKIKDDIRPPDGGVISAVLMLIFYETLLIVRPVKSHESPPTQF